MAEASFHPIQSLGGIGQFLPKTISHNQNMLQPNWMAGFHPILSLGGNGQFPPNDRIGWKQAAAIQFGWGMFWLCGIVLGGNWRLPPKDWISQMSPGDPRWAEMSPEDDPRWAQMIPDDPKWSEMIPDEMISDDPRPRWSQMIQMLVGVLRLCHL